MDMFDVDAAAFGLEIDQMLLVEVTDACERALALASLERAVRAVVESIANPALTTASRTVGKARIVTVRFLGQPLMRWRFGADDVELRLWNAGHLDHDGRSQHLRLRYAPGVKEWDVTCCVRSRPEPWWRYRDDELVVEEKHVDSFRDERQQVLELIRSAVESLVSEMRSGSRAVCLS